MNVKIVEAAFKVKVLVTGDKDLASIQSDLENLDFELSYGVQKEIILESLDVKQAKIQLISDDSTT